MPTAFAQRLLEASAGMERGAVEVTRLVESCRAYTTRTVRISAGRVTALHLLPPLIAAIARKGSALSIELSVPEQPCNLITHEADIAVRQIKPVQQSLIARRVGSCQNWPSACQRWHSLPMLARAARGSNASCAAVVLALRLRVDLGGGP